MGYLLGFFNALTVSLQNSALRSLQDVPVSLVNWFRFAFSALVLGCLVTFFGLWQTPSKGFFLIFTLVLVLELFNSYLYTRAFQNAPQSLVGPLFSVTALFLIPVGYFVLGEQTNGWGIVGIAFIIVGTFFISSNGETVSFKTLSHLWNIKGARYMLGSAFLSSLTVTLTKFSYAYTSPLLFAFYICLGLSCIYAPHSLSISRLDLRKNGIKLAAASFLNALSVVSHYVGLSLILSSYYIAIKRLSVLFDVWFGHLFHVESQTTIRFFGAIFFFLGLLSILLFH